MSEGMSALEIKINQFKNLLTEMREATRDGHILLKDLKAERKEIEKLLTTEVKHMVNEQVDEVVKTELDKIGPEIRKQTNLIYDKVGIQIDKLINLSLGKEFSTKKGHEDLRPILAEKLTEWIREVLDTEISKDFPRPKLCENDHYKGVRCLSHNCSWNF